MTLLRPEKVYLTGSFCKIGILCTWALFRRKEQGEKWAKTLQKRCLAQFVHRCCATSTDKLSQLAGGSEKNTFFVGFLPIFRPVNCFWAENLYMKRIFWEENGLSLLFLATGTTDTKFRRSTGVTTANSTNKYQKYKSVELGDQLDHHFHHGVVFIS